MKQVFKIKKLNMSQIFNADGVIVPITWLEILDKNEALKVGTVIEIKGTAKGKGFQGVMKRHKFRGAPPTHGQSGPIRHTGSIGSETHVSKVIKGKKMPGRMGGRTVNLKNLTILEIKDAKFAVKGPIPGAYNSVLKAFCVE